MLPRRPRHSFHPTLHTLAAGGRQWARRAGQVVACRLLGGLFLLVLIFSRTILPPQMPHPISQASYKDEIAFKRLVLITLEFKKSTFSGNGVYAQSIARSLVRRGHELLVISAVPAGPRPLLVPKASSAGFPGISDQVDSSRENGRKLHLEKAFKNEEVNPKTIVDRAEAIVPTYSLSGVIEIEVEVEQQGWGRLDWKCPWWSFARNISDDAVRQVANFNPSWVLVVDWSALPAFFRLVEAVGNLPWSMAFLNFRIYYLSEFKGEDGEREKQFYKAMESQAVATASAVAALSSRDAHILATELGARIMPGVMPMSLFPPLREDMRILALDKNLDGGSHGSKKWLDGRKFLTCCVRVSPEKNAEIFASIVEVITSFLQEHGITPFLCGGAHGDNPYAALVKSRLRAASPKAVIHEGFMGPSHLSKLYSQTLLNVHPCIYDAYGMTIVEAAAFAAPSLVHVGPGGAVGAAEFLDPKGGLVLAADLTLPIDSVAGMVKGMLLDRALLEQVGWAASKRSLSWSEDANAEQLVSVLKRAPPHTSHHFT